MMTAKWHDDKPVTLFTLLRYLLNVSIGHILASENFHSECLSFKLIINTVQDDSFGVFS